MTLIVFEIHTLCVSVLCVCVGVCTMQLKWMCDLPGVYVGWFIILAQFALYEFNSVSFLVCDFCTG